MTNSVKIFNKIWYINYVESNSDVLGGDYGVCCYKTNTIYVDNGLSDDNIKETLYHELTHALLSSTGFNDILIDNLSDYYEVFVDQLAKVLLESFE